jgi:hypothetical protein
MNNASMIDELYDITLYFALLVLNMCEKVMSLRVMRR